MRDEMGIHVFERPDVVEQNDEHGLPSSQRLLTSTLTPPRLACQQLLTYTPGMKDATRQPKPRRSDETRGRILAAARERFAKDGYERATIRAIATDASIDPALVMRYYGNKEGLFAAAAEFDLHLPPLADAPKAKIGERLVEHLLARWEEDDTLVALLRAAASNETAALRVRDIFASQVRTAVAALGGDQKLAATRAGLISSQILGFALCRYVLRLPPVVAMKRTDIVKWLAPTIQCYASGPSA
jgi:AcrR family transcriptional regulator